MASNLAPLSSLITPARFLFNAGKTPKEWNEKILNDPHFKVIWCTQNSTEIFPNVDIKGGVTVTMYDSTQLFEPIGHYTHFKELNTILTKVKSSIGFQGIDCIIYPQNKFNLDLLYTDYPNLRKKLGSGGNERRLTTSIFQLTEIFSEEIIKDSYKVIGLINNKRVFRYIRRKYIEAHPNLEKYKVFLPKSNGSGAIGEVLSTPLVGEPLVGDTQSFISFGVFDTEANAEACLKYIKTRFARTMLGILKVTQDNSKETWRFVPLQDFTESSDIDWSKSVAEIDAQLYAKYGLSDEEIAFIESMIKPM